MNKIKYKLIIMIIFCSITLLAENRLAIINNSDNYTLVHSGQGKEFKVVDTLFEEDFVYFQLIENSDWIKVSAWNGRQIEGFVHISKIQEIEKLETKLQKTLITNILDKQRKLAENYTNFIIIKDSIAYKNSALLLEIFNDTKYDPMLTFLPKYFCSSNDIEILQLFIATIWANKFSANEMPFFSIGNCFICNPDLVIEQLNKISNIEQKNLIIDDIEWGIVNIFEVDENSVSENKVFNQLKARLDNERKKASQ